jgi:hypothetical protein
MTDTGILLNLTQGYASASGVVLKINNSGTGSDISGTGNNWSVSASGVLSSKGIVVSRPTTGSSVLITSTSTSYLTTNANLVINRSGNLTGVDTEILYELRISPAFTLTEPGSGTFTYYGASIDMTGLAVTAGGGTTVVSALHLKADDDADTGTNYALYVESGASYFAGRVLGQQGADVTAANDTTLGVGNYFDITGTTTINGIAVAGWTAGSTVTLQFDASVTVKHNTAASAGFASLQLAAAGDFSATAGDTLLIIFDGTYWREVSRTVI